MGMDELEVLRAACCVAALDGDISGTELPLLRRLAERAGVGSTSLEAMMDMAREDAGFFEKQMQFLRGDPDRAIKLLFQVAAADGRVGRPERIVVRYFADRLGMTEERFEQILRAAEKRAAGAG
ncbi:MAG: TerB family tellurite resistance protein [Planctomycetota bacterium]|jgi:tellurite resistance protein